MDASILLLLPAGLVGYLLGSIPFGLLFTKLAGYGDVRAIGSGNIGATNVLRTGNKALAAATLLADMLKGTAATIIGPIVATYIIGSTSVDGGENSSVLTLLPSIYVAGLAAFLGHVFPIWLGFKGGKGVATYIGVLIGLAWPAAVAFCAIWLAVAVVTRYSSLSALIASFLTPFAAIFFDSMLSGGTAAAMSIILIFKHHSNIDRLLRGEEPRIGARS